MAEVFGPSFLQDDVMQRLMRHAEISRDRYEQVSPKVRGLIESYQRGIKQFMTEHPEQVPSWAQEIHPWDVIAFGRHVIWNWPLGESAGDVEHAGIKFRPGPYLGSNQMLIAPSRIGVECGHCDHRPSRKLVQRHPVLPDSDLYSRI